MLGEEISTEGPLRIYGSVQFNHHASDGISHLINTFNYYHVHIHIQLGGNRYRNRFITASPHKV